MLSKTLAIYLIEFGHLAAYLALAVALVQGLAPMVAYVSGRPALARLSINAAIAMFALTPKDITNPHALPIRP